MNTAVNDVNITEDMVNETILNTWDSFLLSFKSPCSSYLAKNLVILNSDNYTTFLLNDLIFVTPGDASKESALRFIELSTRYTAKKNLLKTLKHSIIVINAELYDTKDDSELTKNQTSETKWSWIASVFASEHINLPHNLQVAVIPSSLTATTVCSISFSNKSNFSSIFRSWVFLLPHLPKQHL